MNAAVGNLHVSGDWRNVLKSFDGFQGCSGKEAYYGITQSSFQKCCGNYGGTWLIAMKKKNQSIVLPVAGMEF